MLYLIILAIFAAIAISDAVNTSTTAAERSHAPTPYSPGSPAPKPSGTVPARKIADAIKRTRKPYRNPYKLRPYRPAPAQKGYTQYRRPAHPITDNSARRACQFWRSLDR